MKATATSLMELVPARFQSCGSDVALALHQTTKGHSNLTDSEIRPRKTAQLFISGEFVGGETQHAATDNHRSSSVVEVSLNSDIDQLKLYFMVSRPVSDPCNNKNTYSPPLVHKYNRTVNINSKL